MDEAVWIRDQMRRERRRRKKSFAWWPPLHEGELQRARLKSVIVTNYIGTLCYKLKICSCFKQHCGGLQEWQELREQLQVTLRVSHLVMESLWHPEPATYLLWSETVQTWGRHNLQLTTFQKCNGFNLKGSIPAVTLPDNYTGIQIAATKEYAFAGQRTFKLKGVTSNH